MPFATTDKQTINSSSFQRLFLLRLTDFTRTRRPATVKQEEDTAIGCHYLPPNIMPPKLSYFHYSLQLPAISVTIISSLVSCKLNFTLSTLLVEARKATHTRLQQLRKGRSCEMSSQEHRNKWLWPKSMSPS